MTMDVQEIAEQAIPVEERDQSTPVLTVQALKEIKKSRRTVMLAAKLPSATPESPLTPPLSERASNDVEGLYGPEREERYESIALSSEDGEWDHRQGQQSAPPMDASEDEIVTRDVTNLEVPVPRKPSYPTLRRILEQATDKPLPRTSLLPSPPPMTIHDFWANVVKNYELVHRTMPGFLFHKIREGGIPSVLRRVVWTAMAGITPEYATEMNNIYTRLEAGGVGGWDKDIGRDLNRTWPEVEMFKEQDGEGQRGLRGVLGSYSVWDHEVGYCQGLGFLAGPLLMNTSSPAEAFTLLTILMSQPTLKTQSTTGYSLRTLYTPNFPGLLSLIYTFNAILTEHFPSLANHFCSIGLTTEMYAPQWFLSMFAVTGAPVESILLRIWDLLMTEGSNGGHTMIRIGLALMKLNQATLLEFTEMEDALKFLSTKDLWNHIDPDILIGLAGVEMKPLCSTGKLHDLQFEYHAKTSKAAERKAKGELQAVVGQFWGKIKATASQISVDTTNLVAPPMLRSLSKASFSTSPQDEAPVLLRAQTHPHSTSRSPSAASFRGTTENERALHGQIEELVCVLGEVQRKFGEGVFEKDSLRAENARLREMLVRASDFFGSTYVDEQKRSEQATLNEDITEILSTTSSCAASILTCPDSQIEEDLICQLRETEHTLNQERQANALLQQQLTITETELARARSALLDLRNRYGEISRRDRQPSTHSSPPRSPSNGSLRELKLVVKTSNDSSKAPSPGSSVASAASSWGAWFGRN